MFDTERFLDIFDNACAFLETVRYRTGTDPLDEDDCYNFISDANEFRVEVIMACYGEDYFSEVTAAPTGLDRDGIEVIDEDSDLEVKMCLYLDWLENTLSYLTSEHEMAHDRFQQYIHYLG